MKMLKDASTTSDIMTIQNTLIDLQVQIEQIKSRKAYRKKHPRVGNVIVQQEQNHRRTYSAPDYRVGREEGTADSSNSSDSSDSSDSQ